MKNTVAFITFPGDPSVGIRSRTIEVHFDDAIFCGESKDFRDGARQELKDAFKHVGDFVYGFEQCSVHFNDECPDCGQVSLVTTTFPDKTVQVCSNKHCITNYNPE